MLLDLRLYLTIAGIFLYGLGVPFISRLMMASLLGFGLIWALVSKESFLRLTFSRNFFGRLILLIIFVLVYYGLSFEYGIFPLKDCLISVVSILSAYALGYLLNYAALPRFPQNVSYIVLSVAAGGAVFVFLSVNLTLGGKLGSGIPDRFAQNFWRFIDPNQRPIFGPSLDIYNTLGASVLSLLIWGFSNEISRRSYLVAGIGAASISTMALFSSIALQGRKPLLALILSAGLGYLLTLYHTPRDLKKLLTPILAFGFIAVLTILIIPLLNESADQFLLFQRFTSEGLETPRYLLWMTVLGELPENPLGGQLIKLPLGEEHAHNIWLDAAYDAGIPALLLLVSFHLSHLTDFASVIFSKKIPLLVCLSISSALIGFLIPFQVEPIMHSSTTFFALSFFFLGLVTSLAEWLRLPGEESNAN
ncbi:MAG: hypothetical protein SFT81_06460 [Candidatus Caenarcaniphilales bacterium]|nr:hypothetical protein [Candidatus Caenarcaniphilales bacterium]